MSQSQKENTIEKFSGSFSTEQEGCSIFVNSTINLITDGFALGIYTYLMCRPSGWELNAKQLANHFKCNKDKIYKHLSFLKDIGLLTSREVREKGKFLKLHYTVHLHPKLKKSQLNKEVSPHPEKPDAVKPDVKKAVTYKTKNTKNKEYKKTTTTREPETSKNSSSVISKEIDGRLLALRRTYLQADDLERTEEEFLRQCSHHLDNGNKEKYNLTRRVKGLETIIKAGFFEKPAGYNEKKVIKSLFTPEETALMYRYQHAMRMVNLGANLEDYIPNPQDVKKAEKLMQKAESNKPPLEKRYGLRGFNSI